MKKYFLGLFLLSFFNISFCGPLSDQVRNLILSNSRLEEEVSLPNDVLNLIIAEIIISNKWSISDINTWRSDIKFMTSFADKNSNLAKCVAKELKPGTLNAVFFESILCDLDRKSAVSGEPKRFEDEVIRLQNYIKAEPDNLPTKFISLWTS